MSDHPQVLVSVTMLRPEERMLLAALRAAGLTAQPVTALQVAPVLNRAVPAPRAVLLRNLSHQELAAMCQRFAQAGIRTVNSPAAVTVCLAKDLQALMFARAGVPHPITRLAFSVEQVRDEIERLGGDAVLKPVSGSWGRGIVRIRDDEQFDAWTGGRDGLDPGGRAFPVLVQQYVPKPGYNERVHVIGDTAVVAYRQISEGFRTNTRLGGRVEPIEVSPRSRDLCAQIVGCLGPGVYGIDLAESVETGELFVLEVNSSPDFARSSGIHGVDIAGLVARYIKALVDDDAAVEPYVLANTGAACPAA